MFICETFLLPGSYSVKSIEQVEATLTSFAVTSGGHLYFLHKSDSYHSTRDMYVSDICSNFISFIYTIGLLSMLKLQVWKIRSNFGLMKRDGM